MSLNRLPSQILTAATAAILFLIPLFASPSPQQSEDQPQAPPTQRISPEVRARIQGGGLIPVQILLVRQPQAEIYERIVTRHRAQLAAAEERIKLLAETPGSVETDFIDAAGARGSILRDIRREAFAEIEQAIGPAQQLMETRLLAMGAQNVRRYSVLNMMSADIPAAAVEQFESDRMVASVGLIEPMPVLAPVFHFLPELRGLAPDVNNSNKDLDAIHVDAFWDGTPALTGAGQSVASLDSGVSNSAAFGVNQPGGLAINSAVFLQNAKTGTTQGTTSQPPSRTWDACFDPSTDNEQDQVGHGTQVASVIASRQAGYYGVAKGLWLLYNLKTGAAKKFHNCSATNFLDVVAALNWMKTTSAENHIFNFSTGSQTTQGYDIQAQTFDRFADGFNMAIVTVAGEDPHGHPLGAGTVDSPGTAYDVITVGAWDVQHNAVASWSGKGMTSDGRRKPDLVAPGVDIKVATSPSGTTVASGTSLSAPIVTGALALLAQMGISDSLQAKAVLINSATRPSNEQWHSDSGWGLLNLETARQQGTYSWVNALPKPTQANPANFALFTGYGAPPTDPNRPLNATLTWNRRYSTNSAAYPTGFLNNLDMFVYGREAGNRLGQSESTVDNVEFVHVTPAVASVLKVKQVGAWQGDKTSEKYALALSIDGYHAAAGPAFSIACPNGSQDVTQPWTCTITNTGDLPAFGVTVTRNGAEPRTVGTLPGAGGHGTATWTLPPTGGQQAMAVNSTSYDEPWSATANFTVNPSRCPTPTLTPAGPISVPKEGGTYVFQVGVAPGCTFYAGTQLQGVWYGFPAWTTGEDLVKNTYTIKMPPNGGVEIQAAVVAYAFPVPADGTTSNNATVQIDEAEQPYTLQGETSVGILPLRGPFPGVTIHFDLIGGHATNVPADTISDQYGRWQQPGFSWGYIFGQPPSSGATYRATPSKSGYTFAPAYCEWGAQADPKMSSCYFTATPNP